MKSADELRARILEVVLENGGHLASSLGAVELSMALVETFDPFRDRIVWDVGHQAYAWKLLTGRDDKFDTLRKLDGVSPFVNPHESKADAAVAGHAGSALSVALGYATARDIKGTDEHIVAVIGDASIVNGHSFEALNDCSSATNKLIVILNDNGMAISKPTGSFSRFLGRLISGVRYNRVKAAAEAAGHRLRLTFLRDAYHRLESRIKGLFLGNRFFEEFGLRYIGPVDGHDLAALKSAFAVARDDKRSVLVHVVTKKGHGYKPAEEDPTAWHGIGPKYVGLSNASKGISWSDAFGAAICDLAENDSRLVALTAAMPDGTGLKRFAERFPRRFRDVGIAEGHMVAYAAGLAAGGLRPVVAVYSTFLQRAIDQVIHDVALAKLPVVFCVDRAGLVGADGATHQGLYDIALLRSIPGLTICQPRSGDELKALLAEALNREGPTVIRYPRGISPSDEDSVCSEGMLSAQVKTHDKPRYAIWTTGDWFGKAEAVAKRIGGVAVYARYLKPYDEALLARQRAEGLKIVSLENGVVAGGFGEFIGADLRFGWPDRFVPHGSVAELEHRYGLDVDSIVSTILSHSSSDLER